MANSFFKITVGQQQEFHRILGEIGFGDDEVTAVIKSNKPALKLASLVAKFVGGELVFPEAAANHSYDRLLPSLSEQAVVTIAGLEKFGAKVGLSKKQVKSLCTKLKSIKDSDHIQTITDCKVVVVWLGNLRATVRFYQMLVEDRQVEAGANPNWYGTDFEKLLMELDGTAYQYGTDPGVFIADGLNAIDNWNPEDGSSVDKARQNAQGRENYYLASVEALALYATASAELYRAQDGENLPYYDLAGIRSGDGLDGSPCSR